MVKGFRRYTFFRKVKSEHRSVDGMVDGCQIISNCQSMNAFELDLSAMLGIKKRAEEREIGSNDRASLFKSN